MTKSNRSSNSGVLWLTAAIVTMLVIVAVLLGLFLPKGSSDGDDLSVQLTPISGGMPVPTSMPAAEGTNGTDVGPVPLSVGAKVSTISPNGTGTRVYSEADRNALVMEIYMDGKVFVILEPIDEEDDYPIRIGDSDWYRVRTSDGLVGWALAERFVPTE